MGAWWDSASATARVSRVGTMVAVVSLALGLVALLLALPFAVPAFIAGTAAVVVAMFAGFRAAHLRDVQRPQ